jgi:hypothetical protein
VERRPPGQPSSSARGSVRTAALRNSPRGSTLVRAESILLAVGLAGGIGIFFGFYLARKVSRLDPIEALSRQGASWAPPANVKPSMDVVRPSSLSSSPCFWTKSG